jgi:hypothetical protein
MTDEQDWRLKAELDMEPSREALDRLVGRARHPDILKEVGEAVASDVVITHDGRLLFAYAASEAALRSARRAIEAVLRRDAVDAQISVSHWDEHLDEWRQIDPPLEAAQERTEEAAERDAEKLQTRTMVATSGRLIRSEFEQTMSAWAEKLGLDCKIVEHPHLLTTQVAFTVTGPGRKIEEFAEGLRAEELATIRTEREVMLSPL